MNHEVQFRAKESKFWRNLAALGTLGKIRNGRNGGLILAQPPPPTPKITPEHVFYEKRKGKTLVPKPFL